MAADLPLQLEVVRRDAAAYAEQLRQGGTSVRQADAYDEMWAGWKLFTGFLVDAEAVTAEERDRLLERVDTALAAAMVAALYPDVPTSTGARVREMIAYALSAELAHVLDVHTGESPPWPLASRLGHRQVKVPGSFSGSDHCPERTEARGSLAGYVNTEQQCPDGPRELLLHQLSLEAMLKTVAGRLEDPPQMDARTAMRALHHDGVLFRDELLNVIEDEELGVTLAAAVR